MDNFLSKINVDGLMMGLVLGDGFMRIQKNGTNASLEISHSKKQLDYLLYKSKLIELFFGIKSEIKEKNITNKNGKNYPVVFSYYGASSIFTKYYNIIYSNGIKQLTNCLPYFDETSLALFFMDDGSAHLKKKVKTIQGKIKILDNPYIDSFMIATNSFSFTECENFSNHLKNKFNINSTVQKDRNQPRISISQIDSKKTLVKLCKPYFLNCPSIEYKIINPLSYKESNNKISG